MTDDELLAALRRTAAEADPVPPAALRVARAAPALSTPVGERITDPLALAALIEALPYLEGGGR